MYPDHVKVALVHDWLTTVGGAERVLLELHAIFPDAPIFTAAYDPVATMQEFRQAEIRTSFLQRSVVGRSSYATQIPLMPLAFARFDTRPFDLLLVSSHTAAKGVRKHARQVMICYCHTPMRWAWDLRDFYQETRVTNAAAALAARIVLRGFRRWDRGSAKKVDQFIANSETVRGRIQRFYGRDALVIWPPVDCSRFRPAVKVGEHFLIVSRLEDHKRVDLAIQAFTQLGWPLRVVGEGPQLASLRRLAGPSVTFFGRLDDERLAAEYGSARGIIFPAEEDAGLVPLEAMAAGRPVLAFRAGGATEVVLQGVTGDFFERQAIDSLMAALKTFRPESYQPATIRSHALRYDRPHFREAIVRCVDLAMGRS